MAANSQRPVRTVVLSAAAAVLLIVVVLALPAVQLRLVRAVAGGIDGIDLDLGYLWAGPRGVDIESLHLEIPRAGLSVDVAAATVDLATWSSLTSLGLDIEAAALRDVAVRLAPVTEPTQTVAQETAPATSTFAGLAPLAQLPRRLTVRRVEAAGTLALRSPRGVEVGGTWELSAGSLAKDATATLDLAATLDASRLGEALAAATLNVDASADLSTTAQISALTLAAALDPLDGTPGLRATATAQLDAAAEAYRIDLDGANGNTLASVTAALASGRELDAGWEANLTPGIVAKFARGRSVADLEGQTTGRLRADLTRRGGEVQASVDLRGSGWDGFDPRLAGLGALALRLDVDGGIEPGALTARTLALGITSADRGELLRIDAAQPLRVVPGLWLIEADNRDEPALRIQASGLRLAFLGRLSPAINIEEGEISGVLELVRSEERRAELRVAEPLVATGVQLASMRGNVVPAFDVRLVPHVMFGDGALDAEVEDLTITSATGLEVHFEGEARTSRTDWPLAEFEGSLAAHVPVLLRLMPRFDRLRGTTRLQFDFDTLALTIAAATLAADSVDGRELLAVDLSGQRPLHVQLPQFAADWDDFEPRTASVRLDAVPLDWLSPYIPELEIRGGELSGELTVDAAAGRGLFLQSDEPLRITNMLPVFRGRPARDTLSASVRPVVRLSTAGSSVALHDVVVMARTGNELRAEVALESSAGSEKVAMDLTVDMSIAELASLMGLRVGMLHWRQKGEIDRALRRLTLDELELDIGDPDGTELLRFESLQPFAITAEPFAVTTVDSSADVLRAVVTPIRLEQLLPNVFGLDLQGALPQGEFFGRVDSAGGLVFDTRGPLDFQDVTVRWGEATLLDRVTASVAYDVTYSAEGIKARSVDLTATGADGRTLLHAQSEATAPLSDVRLLDQASIAIEANLEPLAQQPVLAGMPRFTAGTLAGSLAITEGAESALTLSASLRNAATATRGAFPDADLMLEATGVRGERLAFDLPIRFASADRGASDLRLGGTLVKGEDGVFDVTAELTGESLAVPDLQRLLDLLVPAEEQEGAAAEAQGLAPLSQERLSAIEKLRAERHSVPFWTDHLLAHSRVAIGHIAFPAFSVDNVRGRLDVNRNAAVLSDVNAELLGAQLSAAANVNFDAAKPQPYALDFHAAVDAIDLKNVFLAVAPDSVPTAEGRFELSSTLTGTGRNPLDLGLSTLGEIRLTGRDGIFRGLAPHAGTGSTAARVVGALTFSRELKAVGRLLDDLGELRFERADILFKRETLDRIDLSSLLVRSPQLRITGSGSLALAAQRPLLLSPLDLSAQLAARGDIAVLFDGMKLLEASADADGYRDLTRVVHVDGTPLEPDVSEFWQLLDEGAGNARGAFGVTLRALNRRLEAGAQ